MGGVESEFSMIKDLGIWGNPSSPPGMCLLEVNTQHSCSDCPANIFLDEVKSCSFWKVTGWLVFSPLLIPSVISIILYPNLSSHSPMSVNMGHLWFTILLPLWEKGKSEAITDSGFLECPQPQAHRWPLQCQLCSAKSFQFDVCERHILAD